MKILGIIVLLSVAVHGGDNRPLTVESAGKDFSEKLNEGKTGESEAIARALLAQEEAAGRPESPETQKGLDLLLEIFIYRSQRSTPEIDTIGLRAVALREKLQGPDSLATAQTVRLWAIAQLGLGNYSSARTLVERSVKIFEKAEQAHYPFSRMDTAQYSRAVDSLAGILSFMMDFNGAKRALTKSILLKGQLAAVSPGMGASYLNLGRLEHYLGNHRDALADYKKSGEILTAAVKPDNPLLLDLLAGRAYCEYETGNKTAGLRFMESALAGQEKIYGPDHTALNGMIDNLGELYRREGRFSEAKVLVERVVAIDKKAYGPLHPELAESEAHLAQVLAELGESQAALQHALAAESIARGHLAISIPTLPEREATLFALKRTTALKTAISVAVELQGDTIEPVYDTLVRSRALVFDELASRHGVRGSASEDSALIARLSEDLRLARERLVRLAIAGASADRLEELHKALDERDSLDRRLATASVQYRRRIAAKGAGLKEVLAALPESTVLVSFVQFERARRDTTSEPGEYAAFILSKGTPEIVWLGAAAAINAAVNEVRGKLAMEAAAPGISLKRSESAYRLAAENLRKLVWDPIERYVAGARRIFIVPDGSLHTINFAALPEAGAEGHYLIERGTLFHYLSAERDLVSEANADPAGTGLLAVGNPSFNRPELARGKAPGTGDDLVAGNHLRPLFRGARSNCSAMRTMQFLALPSSGKEVENISRLWKRGTGGEVVELTGELAGPERFKAMAPGRRTIHLAVHGFVAGTDCTDAVRHENPLLLTGLALAGANRRGASDAGEDGILTAEEIASLDLRGVEWAVLSACDTGLGRATRSEGVFGLQRAFQIAGAHTVIMSLWPVEDSVTSGWMQALYDQRLTKHRDTANAVRLASMETLKRRRAAGQGTHPFYWAAFVAIGDWR